MTTIPANPTAQNINQLLQKLSDSDPDFRFMSLNDLLQVLNIGKPDLLHHDYNTSARTVDNLVKALDDQNGEVQNLAIRWYTPRRHRRHGVSLTFGHSLGPLVIKLPSQIIGPLIEKLASLKLKNSVDNTVPALALRNVIEALPRPIAGTTPTKEVIEAYAGISRVLIPRLLGRAIPSTKAAGATNVRLPPAPEGMLENQFDINSESVDVLIEVVRCFGPMLQAVEVEALQDAVVSLLEKDRPTSVVKKRAVVAISILAVYFSDEVLGSLISRSISILKNPNTTAMTRRLYVTIMGSMARSIPYRFGRHLERVIPFVLGALGQDELDVHIAAVEDGDETTDFNEVRESALVALEAFLASCAQQMRPYTDEVMAACLRYVKYDPNYAVDEDEDMEEEEEDEEELEEDEDDEFEADAGFDDDDDASWKVRRCAAKALFTLISTRSSGDLLDSGVLYRQAAPVLIKRFDEREETVRLEIISAMSLLVRKTGEGVIPEFSLDSSGPDFMNQIPLSRKRRRQSSTGGPSALSFTTASSTLSETGLTSPTLERIPTSGPRRDLAEKTPALVKASTKLLKGKLIPTKQAVINLLDDIVTVQQGGLSDFFDQVIGPIYDAIKPSAGTANSTSISIVGGNASATLGTLRVAALRLTSHIAKTHSSQILQPYLSKIVTGVLAAVHDRFYKISGEAIQTVEEIVKAITPPRSRLTASKYKAELQKLFDVLVNRTAATDVDAEVRQKAIHGLGTLVSRTCSTEGAGLMDPEKRRAALNLLLDRLRNETTRLAAVRAIDAIAASVSGSIQLEPQWVRDVAVELSAQLRKANRSLRGSSVHALRNLTQSHAIKGSLDDATIRTLVTELQPVVNSADTHLLSPGLRILAQLVLEKPQLVMTPNLIAGLCALLQTNVAVSVLDPLLQFVTNVGRSGAGQPLMLGLLKDVGISGDPAVVGKVIGNLLVASGNTAGVSLDSFITEIDSSKGDATRASLALSVLGEAGLRLGAGSPIQPDLFLAQFSDDFDKVSVAAAIALGRAGAGNVSLYVPVILSGMDKGPDRQYLLLQSIKEVLQQVAVSQTDISAYSSAIWDRSLRAADSEDNKAVCAECMGRLAIIAPQTYIPKLQVSNDDFTCLFGLREPY